MSIHAVARVVDPDNASVSITITMTAGEWRQLYQQLETRYPSWPVAAAISHALGQFHEAYTASVEYEHP